MKKIFALIFLFIIMLFFILFFKCQKEKKITTEEKGIIYKEKILEPSAKTKITIATEKENIRYNAFIMKIDADGNCIWSKSFGDSFINWVDFIIETKDKNLLVIGRNYSYNEKKDEIFLSIFDKDGNLKSTKILNKNKVNFTEISEHELNDGILIIGRTYDQNENKPNIYLTKINTDGTYDWSKNFGKEFYEWGYFAYNNYDNTEFIIGLSEDIKELKTDVYLIKKTREQQINKTFGGNEFDWGYSFTRIKDGYLICGITFSFGNGLSDIYLIKVDLDGNCLFAKTIGDKGYDDGYCCTENKDGSFLIGGATTSLGNGGYDIYLVKTDKNGNLLWEKTFGKTSNDACYTIANTMDDCFIIGGIIGEK